MSGAPPRLAVRVAAVLGGLLALAAVGFAADRRGAAAPAPAGAAALALAASASAPQPSPPQPASPSPAASAVALAAASGSAAGASEGPPGILPDGRVVLNVATEDELRKLPGIGASRARAIVALRQRQGKLRALSDLLRVKGIGRKTLARLTPRMVLDPPKG